MDVEVRLAGPDDRPVLRRLMQLYLYDFATIARWDIGGDGLYGNAERIEGFWTDPGMSAFLIRADGALAGFALVRERAYFAGAGTRDISEFFVLRRHRKRGVGERAARRLFDLFPGRWEVAELASNAEAQAFWRRVIDRYTGGRFEEAPRPDGQGVMQRFDSTAR
jgi:predicted acetyltransferase